MSFVCEHCGWVGTRSDVALRTAPAECPHCEGQTFIEAEREVIQG